VAGGQLAVVVLDQVQIFDQQVAAAARLFATVDRAGPCAYLWRMMQDRAWDQEIDARGLLCPLPVLKARKRLAGMAPGQVLRLVATDPAAVVDVPHYCAESGHELIGMARDGEAEAYLIRCHRPKSA
jgi:tRNA 2-thiouridine synthesizing protein A